MLSARVASSRWREALPWFKPWCCTKESAAPPRRRRSVRKSRRALLGWGSANTRSIQSLVLHCLGTPSQGEYARLAGEKFPATGLGQ
jgi:hypothetical protein